MNHRFSKVIKPSEIELELQELDVLSVEFLLLKQSYALTGCFGCYNKETLEQSHFISTRCA